MDATAIITVSAAVVALVQLVKWSGLRDAWGPIAVLLLSLIGIAFWGWSQGTFSRTQAFDYFAAWIAVATSASGVYGFSRASGAALTKLSAPPGGAGDDPTVKP